VSSLVLVNAVRGLRDLTISLSELLDEVELAPLPDRLQLIYM